MKRHCEVRLIDIADDHNITKRSQRDSLQQKQIVPELTSRNIKPNSNRVPKSKRPSILKQEYKIEENKQNNVKRKLTLDTMNMLLAQSPLKQVSTNNTEVQTCKKCNKRNKIRHKVLWESKLTGAKRVSKRLSKLKRENKTLEISKNNCELLKNDKKQSIKNIKKKMLRKNKQLHKRVKALETQIKKIAFPIKDDNLNISKKLLSKTLTKPQNKKTENTNTCKTFNGVSGSVFTEDKETITKRVVTSNSGSWDVKENQHCNTNEIETVITTYSEENEEIKGSAISYQEELVTVENTEESIVTECEECVVSNVWTTLNGNDIQIEVEDVNQFIDNNVIITDVETNENKLQDSSNQSESLKNNDCNKIIQNCEKSNEYLTDNSNSVNVLILSEQRNNIEVSDTKITPES